MTDILAQQQEHINKLEGHVSLINARNLVLQRGMSELQDANIHLHTGNILNEQKKQELQAGISKALSDLAAAHQEIERLNRVVAALDEKIGGLIITSDTNAIAQGGCHIPVLDDCHGADAA